MRRLDCGISGSAPAAHLPNWADLHLGQPWADLIAALGGGPRPRPIQALALGELRFLEQRRNLIVAAPTNAGKSLLGALALLDAVRYGQRAVLLEPLRALAREKYDELVLARARLGTLLGRRLTVRITTGDYRLDQETFASPPPDRGEIIIGTPERFDAILRNSANDAWLASIGCVCVDEAHLIAAPRRGITLEEVLTTLCCSANPPRLVLLSASLGELDRAQAWLSPCDVARVTERYPPLHKEVWELTAPGEEETVDRATFLFVNEALTEPSAQLLVFVYQTRAAEQLARELSATLSGRLGPEGALAYYAQLSSARRETVRQAFRTGRSRCVVATTALGLGVNLPATHVLVRDTTFPGVGPLSAADILQMMGRAGRGDQHGRAVALVRTRDGWAAADLAEALREERSPALISAFEPAGLHASKASAILAQLVRHHDQGRSLEDLQSFFARSLGGQVLAAQIGSLLTWLCDPTRCLAYRDDQGRYFPTVLGQRTAQTMLPLDFAAGAAQLVRDLLSLDRKDRYLAEWQNLDHLILLELLHPRSLAGRRFSEPLAEQVDAWMADHPALGSLLYRQWLRGDRQTSLAAEVLGSLGAQPPGPNTDEMARQVAYLAMFRALILFERGLGADVTDLERRWGARGLDGIEERWRDDSLWLLAGLARILDVRCFYYHLRDGCEADNGRVRRVKGALGRMRAAAYEMRDHLSR